MASWVRWMLALPSQSYYFNLICEQNRATTPKASQTMPRKNHFKFAKIAFSLVAELELIVFLTGVSTFG